MPKKKSLYHQDLVRFVTESNGIEGIHRAPHDWELRAHELLFDLPVIRVIDLSQFVEMIQPGAVLRDKFGLDVIVGNHMPPLGGPEIRERLEGFLLNLQYPQEDGQQEIWEHHIEYETLHPYTDGNGRSGRAIWARSMYRKFNWAGLKIGFLHRFYYQTLQGVRHA